MKLPLMEEARGLGMYAAQHKSITVHPYVQLTMMDTEVVQLSVPTALPGTRHQYQKHGRGVSA